MTLPQRRSPVTVTLSAVRSAARSDDPGHAAPPRQAVVPWPAPGGSGGPLRLVAARGSASSSLAPCFLSESLVTGPSLRSAPGAIVQAARRAGLPDHFDWPRWVFSPVGSSLLQGIGLSRASQVELRRALSVHLIVERSAPGHLERELRSGRMERLLAALGRASRAAALAAGEATSLADVASGVLDESPPSFRTPP